MVKNISKIYKINPYLFFGLFIIVFVSIISYVSLKADDYKVVNPEESISLITLYGNEDYGSLSGAVFYKKNRFIGEAILRKAECNNTLSFEALNIDHKDLSVLDLTLPYKLSDLTYPYSLKKEKDQIYVEKMDCRLVFYLPPYDGPYK